MCNKLFQDSCALIVMRLVVMKSFSEKDTLVRPGNAKTEIHIHSTGVQPCHHGSEEGILFCQCLLFRRVKPCFNLNP